MDVVEHVAVEHGNVQPAIVVEIEEAGAESAGLKRHRAEVLFDSDIGEGFVAIVVKEVVRLVVNICHEEVRFAVPVEVSRIGPHSGLGLSGVPESDFRKKCRLCKSAVAIVAKEKIRNRVICDVKIGPTVTIEIKRHDAESLPTGLPDS